MKKLILFLAMLAVMFSMKAEQKVGEYTNSYFNKSFDIEAVEKNNKIESVYIGISTDMESRKGFIEVKGKELELFKTALELARDKYVEWKRIAQENNVTDMSKEMGINFPKVTIAWHGTQWWFSFGNKINLKFLILDNGKMVASWAPEVTASSNRYIDQRIYFVFGDEEDFNNLISQLDGERILQELMKTKNNSDLFQ